MAQHVRRSLTKTKGDLGSCSRCNRRNARNSRPVNGCVAGVPCLTLRTCRIALSRSICSQRRSTSSNARRPCLKAIRSIVESRCPQRLSLAASISRWTSASVRYSRVRRSLLRRRLGITVRFSLRGFADGCTRQTASSGESHTFVAGDCPLQGSHRSRKKWSTPGECRPLQGSSPIARGADIRHPCAPTKLAKGRLAAAAGARSIRRTSWPTVGLDPQVRLRVGRARLMVARYDHQCHHSFPAKIFAMD
jgi:hypothetical protein